MSAGHHGNERITILGEGPFQRFAEDLLLPLLDRSQEHGSALLGGRSFRRGDKAMQVFRGLFVFGLRRDFQEHQHTNFSGFA